MHVLVVSERRPSTAVMYHDTDGASLLAMLSQRTSCVTIIRLPAADSPPDSASLQVLTLQPLLY